MRVLILEDNEQVSVYYKSLVEQILKETDAKCLSSYELAKKNLESDDYDLVICDLHLEENPKKDEILDFLKYGVGKASVLLLCSTQLLNDKTVKSYSSKGSLFKILAKPFLYQDFLSSIKDMVSSEDLKDLSEYMGIKSQMFLKYDSVMCNVYIKLGKEKYLLLFKEGDQYTMLDIKKYIDKGMEYFYISWQDFNLFISHGSDKSALFYLKDSSPSSIWRRENAALNEIIKGFGVDEVAYEGALKSVLQCIKEVNKSNLALELFNRLKKQNYAYDHGYLTAVVSAMLINHLDSYTFRQSVYLGLAAFLHDLSVPNDISHVGDDDWREYKEFKPYQLRQFLEHPGKMAELVGKRGLFNAEVERIILEHHEKEDGTGFPRGLLANKMHPLSIIFIVSHKFVEDLYKANFDFSKKDEILEKSRKRYKSKKFQRVVLALLLAFEYSKLEKAA